MFNKVAFNISNIQSISIKNGLVVQPTRSEDQMITFSIIVNHLMVLQVVGGIPSSMGAKIVASAVFLDLGIVDSITDKHRTYPASFVIPVNK